MIKIKERMSSKNMMERRKDSDSTKTLSTEIESILPMCFTWQGNVCFTWQDYVCIWVTYVAKCDNYVYE